MPDLPLVSVILLVYQQEAFVRQALESLLAQDYEPMEIVVADDASTDNSWREIEQVVANYQGSKRLILQRNPHNVGLAGNYNLAFARCTGALIFSAAGDDISLPQRCSQCVAWWQAHPHIDLLATDTLDMALDGRILGSKNTAALEHWDIARWFVQRPLQWGASHMLTRRLVALNSLHTDVAAEDQIFVYRALLLGGASRLPAALVQHRRGGVSGKVSAFNYTERKRRLLRSAQQGVAEVAQLRADAERAGKLPLVQTQLAQLHARQAFIQALLQAPHAGSVLSTLLGTRGVPARLKWRFGAFVLLKPLYAAAFRLKALARP